MVRRERTCIPRSDEDRWDDAALTPLHALRGMDRGLYVLAVEIHRVDLYLREGATARGQYELFDVSLGLGD